MKMIRCEIHIGQDGCAWIAEIKTTLQVQERAKERGKVLPRRKSGTDKWNKIAQGKSQEECTARVDDWLNKFLPDSMAMVKTF